MNNSLFLGIDIGSTTVKYVLTDETGHKFASAYQRHKSDIVSTLVSLLDGLIAQSGDVGNVAVALTGSGSMNLSQALHIPFVQEVLCAAKWLEKTAPQIDCAVELGGEDAKLLYLKQNTELRMNEACAGGTGAFIDQMAQLLNTDAAGLDSLALRATKGQTIASRCGVFAKTDVVNLLNTGVAVQEIARSVFDAVAEQTVSGLACGRPLKGNIAFLGGPFAFLKGLRQAFERRLGQDGNWFFHLNESELGVCFGAALSIAQEQMQPRENQWSLSSLRNAILSLPAFDTRQNLEPLFENFAQRQAFTLRHRSAAALRADITNANGEIYLGIDLGSTTVKCVAVDSQKRILWSYYAQNDGHPLERLVDALKELLSLLPAQSTLRSACTTGYGADLAQAVSGAQFSEVETLAHQRAAAQFAPQVTYVIDIGGQDMKCMAVQSGLITDIALNEACSSGCGSFLQTFASQLGLSMSEFVDAALQSAHPCDLGSRCTVFMNSKVRQAQRDGCSVQDIAAGLCRSIVRNALHKVLRIRNTKELGSHVVVQGGTFLNDAVLRAFEQETGLEVVRPDIAGLMGAFGACLIAMERTQDDTAQLDLTVDSLDLSKIVERRVRCKGCGNKCALRVSRFASGKKFISGNRCDFAAKSGGVRSKTSGWQQWKNDLLFCREVLPQTQAKNGVIGIARVLNTFEHYPYWHALFTHLGFHVELSDINNNNFVSGADLATDTIASQNLCYPAKLAHLHVAQLADRGVKRIWMPCIPLEGRALPEAQARFACPVAGSYAEALKLNLPENSRLELLTPFLDLTCPSTVVKAVLESFPKLTLKEVKAAVQIAQAAQDHYKHLLENKAREVIAQSRQLKQPVIILAGHPYHLDPQINHGIFDLIESMGAALITEDAAAMIAPRPVSTDVVNQWTFHSRLYRCAALVAANKDFELVQLVSFGCGLDAITSDQVRHMLSEQARIATLIKVDEGQTLGSARIRLRSLLAAVNDRCRHQRNFDQEIRNNSRDSEAKQSAGQESAQHVRSQGRTIYAPQMAPIHFPVIAAALHSIGWNVEILPEVSDKSIELGLRYVNNDACYPAIVVIGQLLEKALSDPNFKKNNCALLLSQTCGPCRASNYPALLRWALKEAGMPETPVLTLSAKALSGDLDMKVGLKGLLRLIKAVVYGDLLQRLTLFVRTHEKHVGDADRLLQGWTERIQKTLARWGNAGDDFKAMVSDFMAVAQDNKVLPKIGIAGEILLKYHPKANLDILRTIVNHGCEPVLGDISAFVLYSLYDSVWKSENLGTSKFDSLTAHVLIGYIEHLRAIMRTALKHTPVAEVSSLDEMLSLTKGLVSAGQQAGEGWLLTSEMAEFAANGASGVICLQPFGCLPNHVTGKGVIRALRSKFNQTGFCALDYDAGTSHANANNRLKLFLEQAKKRFGLGNDNRECAHSRIVRTDTELYAVSGNVSSIQNRRIIPIIAKALQDKMNCPAVDTQLPLGEIAK